jgi:exonuclease SbcD
VSGTAQAMVIATGGNTWFGQLAGRVGEQEGEPNAIAPLPTMVEASNNIDEKYLDAFPAQNFPAADYIALGHIHRAQMIGGCDHIRYCGSPIALSFDETGKSKSVHLVSFENGRLSAVETLEVPVTQQLAVLKGDLASITRQLEQWRGVEQASPVWLDIEITTDEYLHNMQRKIQSLTEDLPVEVLLIRRSREQREKILLGTQRETLSELRVEEVFERRLAQEELDDARRTRLNELFNEALHTLNNEEPHA